LGLASSWPLERRDELARASAYSGAKRSGFSGCATYISRRLYATAGNAVIGNIESPCVPPWCVTARRRGASRRPAHRAFEELVKRRHDRVGIIAVLHFEQPVADERLDLGAVNFDGETAITSPTSRPATAHARC
jgi:hypothetical protein